MHVAAAAELAIATQQAATNLLAVAVASKVQWLAAGDSKVASCHEHPEGGFQTTLQRHKAKKKQSSKTMACGAIGARVRDYKNRVIEVVHPDARKKLKASKISPMPREELRQLQVQGVS